MARELSLIAQAARHLTLSNSKVYGKGDLTNRQCKACVVCVPACVLLQAMARELIVIHTHAHILHAEQLA